jgi:cysteinyl-tRNA synthetase
MNKNKIIFALTNLNLEDAEIKLGDLIVGLKASLLKKNIDNMSAKEIIQELIDIRQIAREDGQYVISDDIRERLKRCDVILKDRNKTTTWEVVQNKEKINESPNH